MRTYVKGARVTGEAATAFGVDAKQRYEKGKSIRAIATESGRSYGTVHAALRLSGAPLRTNPRRALTADEASQIAQRYRAGECLRELAAGFGTSRSTIWRSLRASGVTLRPRGGHHQARAS